MARKVVHLTSVHPPTDNRIRFKECATLAAEGWEVVLVACSGGGDPVTPGVRLRAIKPARSRLARMTLTAWRVYRAALAERADVYQIHDPELLPWALLLRFQGRRVVYDVHEDAASTMAYKAYMPRLLRLAASRAVGFVEASAARWMDAIIAATPHIGELASRIGPPVVVVQNFPRLEEVRAGGELMPYARRPPGVVYAGGIARVRGVTEMLDAMAGLSEPTEAKLHLAGRWQPPELRDVMVRHPGWPRVVDHGLLNRRELVGLLGDCRVGLVTIWPERNYVNAYATKMFEYMAMGLPVVASDFPLWRRIVEDAGCGLLVDSRDPEAIAEAVGWLFRNPVEAEAMGRRGRAAVHERYNWGQEARKLLSLYNSLLGGSGRPAVSEGA